MSSEPEAQEQPPPLLVVMSGPSGVGKDAVFSHMRDEGRPYHYTVTATTRPKRANEREGADYIFLAEAAFRGMIERGELLEWAEVYGHLYGVPRSQVAEALSHGVDVLVKTDVQGVANIRRIAPDAVFIFLAPPSMEELSRRLSLRLTDSPEVVQLRLSTAEAEMATAPSFDYTVVNHRDQVKDAVREIDEIVAHERRRVPPRRVAL